MTATVTKSVSPGPDVSGMQSRLIYSLLKPAVRAAARFRIPIRTLIELLRLAYCEHLARDGLSTIDIAERFGQTARNIQSLTRRLKTDFFSAERHAGLVREIEAYVAAALPADDDAVAQFSTWSRREVCGAIELLLSERRIERTEDGRLRTARAYVLMGEDQFHHRIDSLNHFMDGTYRSVLHRLIFDDRRTAMMKSISFSALGGELVEMLRRLEGELRRDVGALDESATFAGRADDRYTLVFGCAPLAEPDEENR